MEENWLTIENGVLKKCSNEAKGEIVIPDSVTEIDKSAFRNHEGITSIVIPDSVTKIGEGAFYLCEGLTSIVIPASVTSIGEYAFSCCSKLESIKIYKNNKVYDSRDDCNAIIETKTNILIAGCNKTIIPNSVTEIARSAFEFCISLRSLVIPESVTCIRKFAFFLCHGLESIKVDKNNKVYDSRDDCNAIIETASNTLIVACKNTIKPDSVTEIGVACNALYDYGAPYSYSYFNGDIDWGIDDDE